MSDAPFSTAPGVLIAMPRLDDLYFARSVVLMIEHTEDGALGLVINRPTDQPAQRVAKAFDIEWSPEGEARLLRGGPVDPQALWMLHDDGWTFKETSRVIDGVSVSRSREALSRICDSGRPITLLVGCAGWGPGQLEGEIAKGAWLVGPAAPEMLEWPVEERWSRALRLMGVDPAHLTDGGSTAQ